jgi:hypothetical protein
MASTAPSTPSRPSTAAARRDDVVEEDEVDEDVTSCIFHPSDAQVRPISQNPAIEKIPTTKFDSRTLPVDAIDGEAMAALKSEVFCPRQRPSPLEELEAFLRQLYAALVGKAALADKVNVAAYVEDLARSPRATDVLANTTIALQLRSLYNFDNIVQFYADCEVFQIDSSSPPRSLRPRNDVSQCIVFVAASPWSWCVGCPRGRVERQRHQSSAAGLCCSWRAPILHRVTANNSCPRQWGGENGLMTLMSIVRSF